MKKRMFSISLKILFMLIIFVVVVGGGIGYSYITSEGVIKDNAHNEVSTISNADIKGAQSYLNQLIFNVELVSSLDIFSTALIEEDYEKATILLKEMHAKNESILHVDLIDNEGFVVTSSLELKIGDDKNDSGVYLEGKQGTYFNNLHISSSALSPAFGVSTPVISSEGETIGVLLIDLKADKLNEAISHVKDEGAPYESILVNSDFLLVSPSKYSDLYEFDKTIEQDIASDCLAKKLPNNEQSPVTSYENYDEIKVIGTAAYIPELNVCIITEANEDEVISNPILAIQKIDGSIMASVILTVIIIWLFSYKFISGPLNKMTIFATEIARGRINVDFPKFTSNDEVGALSDAFYKLVVSLKLAMREDEAKVKDEDEAVDKPIQDKILEE